MKTFADAAHDHNKKLYELKNEIAEYLYDYVDDSELMASIVIGILERGDYLKF